MLGPVSKPVKTKRPCCDSNPRCKRCPVVLKRLDKMGRAKRTGKRTYLVGSPAKREMKAARAR
jgi:hypothetical protein